MTWWDAFKVDLEPGELDGAKIERFTVGRNDPGRLYYILHGGRDVPPGDYTRLEVDGKLWMSDTRAEVADLYEVILQAERMKAKRVLVNGLGMGVVVFALLKQVKSIERIDVVEKDQRVVKLVGSQITDPRVHIHVGDAYTYQWERGTTWDLAWHDVWLYISGDNQEGITRLKRRYARRVKWQAAWVQAEVRRLNREEGDRMPKDEDELLVAFEWPEEVKT